MSEAKEVSGDVKIHRIFGLGSNHNLLQQVGNFDPALEQIQGTKAGKPKEYMSMRWDAAWLASMKNCIDHRDRSRFR